MKTTMKFLILAIVAMATTITSCSKDGADGATGAVGPTGPVGAVGANGENGEDGNANVTALKFDLTAVSGNSYVQTIPELTEEVLNDYAILAYIKRLDGGANEYNPIPGTFGAVRHIVRFTIGQCKLDFASVISETVFNYSAGQLVELRVIFIAPSSVTGKNASMDDLKKLGVDINDYYAVMDYFGLDY